MGWRGPQTLPESKEAVPHAGLDQMCGPSSGRWLGEGHPCSHQLASVRGAHPGPVGQTSAAATMLELTRGFLQVWHGVQSGPGDGAPPGPPLSGSAGGTLSWGV